jgi:two-component system response regulator CpxR
MDGPIRLLVVDDDTELCELLEEYLEPHGFSVMSIHDGESGLRTLAGQPFDAVILDVMLPGRDGLEVLRGLRARSDLPVLMLTARGDDVDRIVGLELGADDYLPKPFNPRELLARLRAILRRSRRDAGETAGASAGGGTSSPRRSSQRSAVYLLGRSKPSGGALGADLLLLVPKLQLGNTTVQKLQLR